MDLVRAWVFHSLERSARRYGLPASAVYRHTSFSAAARRRMTYVPWVDFCQAHELVEAAAGGPERLNADFAESFHTSVPAPIRLLVRSFTSPERMARFASTVLAPATFPCLAHGYEDLGDGRARVSMTLPGPSRPSLSFFRSCEAAMRNLPRVVGLPTADSAVERLDERGLCTVLTLPASESLVARARRRTAATFDAMLDLLDGPHGALRTLTSGRSPGPAAFASHGSAPADDVDDRVARAATAWGLTRRESEVLTQLMHGLTNKAIAAALACSESTVEFHVTNIFRRSGVTGRGALVNHVWRALGAPRAEPGSRP